MNNSDNTVSNGLGSEVKVQAITGDFLPQSEIVIVLVLLIILLFLLHLLREIWMCQITWWKYLTDFISNMKCMPNIEYFRRTESSQTFEKKSNVDFGKLELSKTVN